MTIKGIIEAYRDELEVSTEDLVKYAGISKATLYRCYRDSDLWKLGTLNSIYKLLNVPKEERIYT